MNNDNFLAGRCRMGHSPSDASRLDPDLVHATRALTPQRRLTMFAVLSLPLAAAYLLPGSAKLLAHPKMRRAAAHFGIPWSRYRLLGAAELAAAAGILIGIRWPVLGVAAAVGMIVLLLGALLTHRRAGDPAKEAIPALLVLLLTITYLIAVI
jgi:DoxX-like protein